jgi:flagellin-specific chaperone FliS
MFAVQGIYDEGVVTIKDPVPVNKKYNVIVTFLKPAELIEENSDRERKLAALKRITGVISGNTMTLDEARTERLSRQ